MALSPRQWLVIAVLIVGFVGAALIVANDDAPAVEFDQATWCAGAQGLAGLEPLFVGTAETATADDYDAAKEAFYAVENTAPLDLRQDVGYLANFAFVAVQEFNADEWPDVFAVARANVDTDAVDTALTEVTRELQTCGVTFAG